MKKWIFISSGGMVFLACIFFLFFFAVDKKEASEPQAAEIPTSGYSYLVKEYEGKIAVFEENAASPFRVTSVALRDLPENDKILLKEGIKVTSLEELNDLLEDYCS